MEKILFFNHNSAEFSGALLAERVGFEPTDLVSQVKRFRVAPVRPLWHLSVLKHSIAAEAALPFIFTIFDEL
jgi:hypothetical protein